MSSTVVDLQAQIDVSTTNFRQIAEPDV